MKAENMKNRIYLFLLSLGLLIAATGLYSCTDEDFAGACKEGAVLNLSLPEFAVKHPATRSGNERTVHDLLAVILRDGKAKYGVGSSFSENGNTVSATLTGLTPQSGETLYLFCNTGITSVTASNETELLNKVSFHQSSTGVLAMYGKCQVTNPASITLDVEYSIAKAELTCSAPGYTVESWKICNVPSHGYAGQMAGYPAGTTYNTAVVSDGGVVYFVPRTDNSTAPTKTFLIAKLKDIGWFRLDFYDKSSPNELNEEPLMIDLERNTCYKFKILSVTSKGYSTEEEAAANIGGNIEYSFEITRKNSASNGQYVLQLNNNEITLYPVSKNTQSKQVLTVSAIIPGISGINIQTYSVTLVSPNGQITLDGNTDGDGILNLMQPGTKLTTANSEREIVLNFTGAHMEGSYLEVRLGDICKQVPIRVLSANSYLYDFTQTGRLLLIPIAQANLDKERISASDEVVPKVVWSDQPNLSLTLSYNKTAGWIEVTNNSAFVGNVVIAANVNGETKWSWHIWSMDNTVLEFNSDLGIYDMRSSCVRDFNNFTWMDRNLGAYDLSPGIAASRGLCYQWGRKDPFPGGQDGDEFLKYATVYCGATSFTLQTNHPDYGSCIETPANDTNLDYSVQYPIRIIAGRNYMLPNGVDENDWYTGNVSKRNNYLWLTKDKKKTAYNPCPAGWTLPHGEKSSPFVGLWHTDATSDKYGMTFGTTYYPYTPCIYIDGSLITYDEINMKNSWVILPWGDSDDTGKSCTIMNSAEVSFRYDSYRSVGTPLRCVRE